MKMTEIAESRYQYEKILVCQKMVKNWLIHIEIFISLLGKIALYNTITKQWEKKEERS